MWFILSGHRIPTPSRMALFCTPFERYGRIPRNSKVWGRLKVVPVWKSGLCQLLSLPLTSKCFSGSRCNSNFLVRQSVAFPKILQSRERWNMFVSTMSPNTIYDQKKILTLSTSLVLLQIIHSTKSSLSVTQEPKRSIVYPLSQNDFMGYGNKTQQTSSEANKARVESCVLVPSPCLPVLKGQRPTTHSRTLTLSLFHS